MKQPSFRRESATVIWATVVIFMIVLVEYLPDYGHNIVLFVCVLIAAAAGFVTCKFCNDTSDTTEVRTE